MSNLNRLIAERLEPLPAEINERPDGWWHEINDDDLGIWGEFSPAGLWWHDLSTETAAELPFDRDPRAALALIEAMSQNGYRFLARRYENHRPWQRLVIGNYTPLPWSVGFNESFDTYPGVSFCVAVRDAAARALGIEAKP